MFNVKNKDTRTWCLFVKFEYISHLCSDVFTVNFEHANTGWVVK